MIIKVSGNNCAETYFKIENKKVYYKNNYITGGIYAEHPKDIYEIMKHFENMLKLGFRVEFINS